jgi:two-component system OmpR family sensor kinase
MMIGAMAWHVQSRRRAAKVVERLAAERERLIERERLFFANVTHDLMTPLTIARGNVEVLRRSKSQPEESLDEACGIVLDELGRMEGLVEDLLLVGQLDSPERLGRIEVDVPTYLVDDAIPLLRARAASWRVDIDAPGTLSIDPTALGRAIANLVDNAVAHSRRDDVVTVRARARGDELVIEVMDEGSGIPAEALPHVFDRFWRGDRSRSRRRGGSGLGLSIVQAVAVAHGGTARVVSTGPQGTRVAIELPGFVPGEPEPPYVDGQTVPPEPPRTDGRRRTDPAE